MQTYLHNAFTHPNEGRHEAGDTDVEVGLEGVAVGWPEGRGEGQRGNIQGLHLPRVHFSRAYVLDNTTRHHLRGKEARSVYG